MGAEAKSPAPDPPNPVGGMDTRSPVIIPVQSRAYALCMQFIEPHFVAFRPPKPIISEATLLTCKNPIQIQMPNAPWRGRRRTGVRRHGGDEQEARLEANTQCHVNGCPVHIRMHKRQWPLHMPWRWQRPLYKCHGSGNAHSLCHRNELTPFRVDLPIKSARPTCMNGGQCPMGACTPVRSIYHRRRRMFNGSLRYGRTGCLLPRTCNHPAARLPSHIDCRIACFLLWRPWRELLQSVDPHCGSERAAARIPSSCGGGGPQTCHGSAHCGGGGGVGVLVIDGHQFFSRTPSRSPTPPLSPPYPHRWPTRRPHSRYRPVPHPHTHRTSHTTPGHRRNQCSQVGLGALQSATVQVVCRQGGGRGAGGGSVGGIALPPPLSPDRARKLLARLWMR